MDLSKIRQDLHRIPELAFEENKTQQYILSILTGYEGITIHTFQKSTGILVEYCHGEGEYLLFRADMDALPVEEQTACAFVSATPGMMHACGHDVHMTILLGLIDRVLSESPSVNLLFLFQPAEEGKGGAESILSEGVIQRFPIKYVFALHVAGGMPVGTVASRAGIFFGIPQEFDVIFTGKAAHAAFPEQGCNALTMALTFLSLMNTDVEDLSAEHRVIFHVGKLETGVIRNVVPEKCVIEGTHRSLEKGISKALNVAIAENASIAAEQVGGSAEVKLLGSYDPVVNDATLVENLVAVCDKLGVDFQNADTAMTGEDFGFFTTLYPGLLFWLGSGCDAPLHSGTFLPNKDCIETGVRIFYGLLCDHLTKQGRI